MPTKKWKVYIVRCSDRSLYTGVTTDLDRRLRQHNGELAGGARYTCVRRPIKLVYSETKKDRSTASIREYEIKSLTRVQKLQLIKS